MKHTVRRSFTTRIFATVLLVALLPLLMMNVALTPLLVDRVEGQRSAQAQTGLGEAVSRLPLRYRQVIHLFYHEGYQTAQIAKVLGRNESTVRSDLRRGREKLKEVLKGEYDFEEV